MILDVKLLKFRKFLSATLFAPSGAARSAAHDYEMSIRAAAARLLHNGRLLLRSARPNQNNRQTDVVDGFGLNILPKRGSAAEKAVGSSSPAPTGGRGASVVRNVAYKFHQHARRLFVDNVLRRVTNSQSAELRERATKRLLYGDSAPFFALVGVSLASGTGILTKDDELEGVCWEIREAVSKLQWSISQLQSGCHPKADLDASECVSGLKDLDVGPMIAKGCSAVVYAAKLKETVSDTGEEREKSKIDNLVQLHDSGISRLAFPLALKMMFNYDAESNASAILRAMYRETVPAPHHLVLNLDLEGDSEWATELASRVRRLPPHPNIVEILGLFADRVPFLPGSLAMYPDALPSRLNPEGSGRNMSLFLLMKRYDTSMKQYLEQHSPSVREATLLLTQLLEAVTHMTRHGVAHRDLKSDNLLLTLLGPEDGEGVEEEPPCPLLAVTDFGCCLADAHHGLSMPYHSAETDRGGNTALMAPEVACARVGPFSSISYRKSDAWACGALAYELFCGGRNPFYSNWAPVESESGGGGDGGGGETAKELPALKSRSYREEQLPPLPADVPPLVAAVVAGLLVRAPHKRLSAEMAATILQLHLWAPSSWLGGGEEGPQKPTSNEILQWLLCLTTKVLCEGGLGLCAVGGRRTLAEYRLISALLSRASLHQIKAALAWAVAAAVPELY
ncbi:serine/threonine-protein kinase Pink1, mitochondrial [Schistocerca piceifrons]|uniref:serine/threonine-protein kinase Pink1, mitochondrial n=1 Tax=Schistocerca piceifrons TaxID=274613 RepID=UPI001F5E684B|nr:serine/threonine-protein kinase Pink1, mitochondrial [Schistocerca piceifrons]